MNLMISLLIIGFSTVPELFQTDSVSLCPSCYFYCPQDNGTSVIPSVCDAQYILAYKMLVSLAE